MANADRCATCGAYVPEGRQVCVNCEHKTETNLIETIVRQLEAADKAIRSARSMLALLRRDA